MMELYGEQKMDVNEIATGRLRSLPGGLEAAVWTFSPDISRLSWCGLGPGSLAHPCSSRLGELAPDHNVSIVLMLVRLSTFYLFADSTKSSISALPTLSCAGGSVACQSKSQGKGVLPCWAKAAWPGGPGGSFPNTTHSSQRPMHTTPVGQGS